MGGPAVIGGTYYRSLDNFHQCRFTVACYTFTSAEQYFQAAKFVDPHDPSHRDSPNYPHFLRILECEGGMAAWDLGQSRKFQCRNNWNAIRESVMRDGVRAKLEQNPAMKAELMESVGEIDVPRSDHFWRAANARILTQLRDEFLAQANSEE